MGGGLIFLASVMRESVLVHWMLQVFSLATTVDRSALMSWASSVIPPLIASRTNLQSEKMVMPFVVFTFFQKKVRVGMIKKDTFVKQKDTFFIDKRALSSPLPILCIYYRLVFTFLFKIGRVSL